MNEKNEKNQENSLNRDIIKYLPVKIIPAFSGLLTIYLLTRTLSTGLYADYAFIIATILLFGQLISGWINSSILFFYPDYVAKNLVDVLKINVITLQLLLFLLGSFGFAITSYFGLKDFKIVFIGLLLLLSQTFLNLLYSFLQAERRIFVQIRSTTIQSLIQIFGMLFCYYYYKENLHVVLLVLFLSYFIASNYVMYSDKIYGLLWSKYFFKNLDFNVSKNILLYGLPICIWFFASQFYVIGDRILFKYFHENYLVSNYASFRDLSVGLSGFITMPLLLASHPVIVQMWKNKEETYKIEKILSENIKLLITLFTPILIGIFLVGDWILTKIVGTKYLLNNNLMFLVVLSVFFGTVSMYLHKGLEVTGRTVLMAKIALSVALLSLLLNVTLIPTYGVPAACLVAVISQILYCILVYYFSKKSLSITIEYRFLLKNIFFIAVAYVIFNFIFVSDSSLIVRFAILIISTTYLFVTSREIEGIIKMIRK